MTKEIKNEVFSKYIKTVQDKWIESYKEGSEFSLTLTLELVDLPYAGKDDKGNEIFIDDDHEKILNKYLFNKSKDYNIVITSIIGYASAEGDEHNNLFLSESRAWAVYRYLEETMISIPNSKLILPSVLNSDNVKGKGELKYGFDSELVIDEDGTTSSDWSPDRKVEIHYTLGMKYNNPIEQDICSINWEISFEQNFFMFLDIDSKKVKTLKNFFNKRRKTLKKRYSYRWRSGDR